MGGVGLIVLRPSPEKENSDRGGESEEISLRPFSFPPMSSSDDEMLTLKFNI